MCPVRYGENLMNPPDQQSRSQIDIARRTRGCVRFPIPAREDLQCGKSMPGRTVKLCVIPKSNRNFSAAVSNSAIEYLETFFLAEHGEMLVDPPDQWPKQCGKSKPDRTVKLCMIPKSRSFRGRYQYLHYRIYPFKSEYREGPG